VIHSKAERARYDALRQQHLNRARQSAYRSTDSGQDVGQSHYQQFNDPQTDQEFADFIQSIFGGSSQGFSGGQSHRAHAQPSHKGQDVEIEFPLFLEETLVDTVKPIEFILPQRDSHGRVIEQKKTLNVKIPAGVVNGERIRLKGQGAASRGKGANGDVYLQIHLVPHPTFDVDGHNLSIVVPIMPWEAALGCKINLPTLQGKVQMNIPPNSQTGQRLRLKGKGLVSKKVQGDLYAVLKIVNPPSSDAASTKLWKELAEQVDFDPRSNWGK
jgi:curved DNA-binding protein